MSDTTTKRDDGGPAFPWQLHGRDSLGDAVVVECGTGLSIRDYFAAEALRGLCSNPMNQESSKSSEAKWAYEYADAMLAERSK